LAEEPCSLLRRQSGILHKKIKYNSMSGEAFTMRISPITTGSIMKYIYYGSILAFIIISVLVLLNYTTYGIFSLNPSSGAYITIPIAVNGTDTAFSASPISPFESTRYKTATVKQIKYTVSFDLYIKTGLSTGTFRPIFYNGKRIADKAVSTDTNIGKYLTKNAAGTDAIHVTPADISTIQTGLFNNSGNICLYLSKDTNDLNLMYYVAGSVWGGALEDVQGSTWVSGSRGSDGSWGSGGSGSFVPTIDHRYNCGSGGIGTTRENDDTNHCESASGNGWITKRNIMKNVPLQTPFRITLAVDPNFIEIYKNGDLIKTVKTPGVSELYTYPSSTMAFMGPPDFSPDCNIANITYWNQVLPARSIRLFSSTPVDKKVFNQ